MGIPGPGNSLYKGLAASREHSECGGGRQGPDPQDTRLFKGIAFSLEPQG